jgi:P-type Cu+ transporter
MHTTREQIEVYGAGLCAIPILAYVVFDLAAVVPLFDIDVLITFATLLQLLASVFYVELLESVKARRINVYGLVAISTTAAWLLSILMWLDVGSDAGVAYIGLNALLIPSAFFGRLLASRVKKPVPKGRADEFIMPRDARPRVARGMADKIPLKDVRQGDLLQIYPGEIVPVDGKITQGIAEFLGGELTGDPMPRNRGPGDRVRAGETCFGGAVVVQAIKSGFESQLAEAVSYGRLRSHYEENDQVADKILTPFGIVVLLIFVAVFVGWSGLLDASAGLRAALAVLAICMPAGIALAGSLPLYTGAERLARKGVLLHRDDITEAARKIDELYLTPVDFLIMRSPKMHSVRSDEPHEHLIADALSMTNSMDHPMAGPLQRAADQRGITDSKLRKIYYEPGRGFTAAREGGYLLLGNPSLLSGNGVGYSNYEQAARDLEAKGCTVWWMAETEPIKRCIGLIAFQPEVRNSSKSAVLALQAQGIKVSLVPPVLPCRYLGALAHIPFDAVIDAPTPEYLYQHVIAYQHQGRHIAAAGLSPLDFPAIQAADLTVISRSGPPMLLSYAAMSLSRSDPALLADGFITCRKMGKSAAWNLWLSMGFAGAGVIMAGLGVLTPLSANAIALASLGVVVVNSLKLRLSD